jgi:hypothetical protein
MKVLHFSKNSKTNQKSLEDHLVCAGLITPTQLQLAIHEQKLTRQHFVEIVVDRGWVKESILEDLANRLMGMSFMSVRYLGYRPA